MSSERVAIVTQWFAPEPSTQPVRIARMLRDAGKVVTVLTGVPNYPTGRTYAGYKGTSPTVESFEGMTVRRTPLYPSHDQNTVGRLVNYASWALSSALWGRKALREQDVALVYSSPATAALAAMAAKRLYGIPYVLVVQDIWPDSIFASGFLAGRTKRFVEFILSVFVNGAYANASRIAVISPGMKDLLAMRGVPHEKLSLVYNSPGGGSEVSGAPERMLRADLGLNEGDFVLMYAGNHGAAQGLDALVAAMGELPPGNTVKLVMVGDGVMKSRLQAMACRQGQENIQFLPSVPREKLDALSSVADVQVVALADEPLFSVTMPSKVQSILAQASPMLAIAHGDVADVAQKARCGVSAAPGDPVAIARAIQTLADCSTDERQEMGAAGRRYFETEMGSEVNNQRLLGLLEDSARERVTRRRRARAWHLR